MRGNPIVRFAAVLALAGLAACDTPTVAVDSPAQPAFNLPVAQMSVTDPNGTPLVSWNAVSGATGYTVRLINFQTQNGSYVRRSFQTLHTTTGTSFLDTGHAWTGVYQCDGNEGPDGIMYGYWLEYEVVSQFPTGTSSSRHYAYIAEC